MAINLYTRVLCPYCGLENNVLLDIDSHYIQKRIVECDIEKGGCDKEFVIAPRLEITADVYKIERI